MADDYEEKDIIWIAEAQIVYNRSRAWLEKQVDEGKITKVLRLGTSRVYLVRKELDALLGKPEPK
jgi:hypothetical protein